MKRLRLNLWIVFCVGLALTFVGTSLVWRWQNDSLQSQMKYEARLIAQELEAGLEARISVIERLAWRLKRDQIVDKDYIVEEIDQIQRDYPGFQAIAWVNQDHVVQWIFPLIGNELVLGMDLKTNPNFQNLRKSVEAGEKIISPVLKLREKYQILSKFPVDFGERYAGHVSGNINLKDLMGTFSERLEDRGLSLSLSFADQEIYYWHSHDHVKGLQWKAVQTLTTPGGSLLSLSVWPGPKILDGRSHAYTLIVFLFGLSMTSLICLLVRYANIARSTASTLQEVNGALELSTERFQGFTEIASDWLWECDENLKLTYLSSGFLKMTGYDALEMRGRSITALFFAEDDTDLNLMKKSLNDGRSFRGLNCRIKPSLAALSWVSVSGKPVLSEDGSVRGYRGAASDVTKRIISDGRFRSLFELSSDALVLIDGQSIIDCNRAALHMSGYVSKEEFLRLRLEDLTYLETGNDEAADRNISGFMDKARNEGIARFECHMKTISGRRVPIEMTITRIISSLENRELVSWRDVSETNRKADEIRRHNATLKTTMEAIDQGLCMADPRGRIVAVNALFYRIFELDEVYYPVGSELVDVMRALTQRGDLLPSGVSDSNDLSLIINLMEKVRKQDAFSLQGKMKSGRQVLINGFPVPNGGLVLSLADISARLEAEAFQQSVASNLPGAIYRMVTKPDDHHRDLLYISEGALSLIGAGVDEEFESIEDLKARIIRDDFQAWMDSLDLAERSLIPDAFEMRVDVAGDSDGKWIKSFARPVAGQNGEIVWDGILLDITSQKKTELALEQNLVDLQMAHEALEKQSYDLATMAEELSVARDQSDAANRSKSEFLATMSHEIRTPMNGVMGMAEMMLDTNLDEQQAEYLNMIRQSGEALLDIINDVLDISKIEAGRMDIEYSNFDLLSVSENTINLMASRAHDKGLDVGCYVHPDLKRFVIGDGGRVRQILLNLLGNAMKFTEEGSVTLSLCPCEKSEQEGQEQTVLFEIVDTGIGIAEDAIERLFDKFTQADASTTRRFGGTGLGLAICKQLVGLMGGEIGVSSVVGEGSRFWFRLPLRVQDGFPQTIGPIATPEISQGLGDGALVTLPAGSRIETIQRYFEDAGIDLTYIRKTDEVLEHLDSLEGELSLVMVCDRKPDDIALKINGLADRFAKCSKVMMTRQISSEREKRAADMGYDAVLNQPVTHSQISNMLQQLYLSDSSQTHTEGLIVPGPGKHFNGENEKGSVESLKGDNAHILVVEDNAINQKLAQAMLLRAGFTVEIAENGQVALDLLEEHGNSFSIIMMDMQMPVMDGLETTRRIRKLADSKLASLPIIAMTANAMEGDREICLAAGMDDYISKPINAANLMAAISRHLASSSMLMTGAREDAPLQEQKEEAPLTEEAESSLNDILESLSSLGK
ncbi:ATP-binding protein [Kiloniella sp. b19]|uniref:ATP-binding protein n=1 Tax=Kiloniella sp. GXU_MW_B19 TaxID=3141326 RepID=UPI0031DFBDDB